mmetsp:Transcript_24566/g.69790  ORF Transcript_24566/g.69790 Transcript_24566/m.69790 type:complete len:530 (-) Transcript_24566:66-1655(-)|eukprot:CAMPEP_0177193524 /NCGR_PEP_ID=MMETSP0367-20130122/22483_1 /TAXON_ID=447022 ORGANISM="Scrippsiella hangoei-like, Strain SHHI-4" /NCGR_SAMPLE_ID=MMETSP0367 /ASSEMBLY_ACC=CAM_ASM_000362 /LENGTH=529 /DNA_ID=CAMNT_0018641405 /DNA_START=60 /DNA_END=1649 /DNA_ORIENTATION=+
MTVARSLAACSVSLPPLLLLSMLGRQCRALDAEQVHVSVVGSAGVCISWASPGSATANLIVQEVEIGTTVEIGPTRVIQPMTTSYRYEGSDGMGGSYGVPGVYTSPLLLHAHVEVRPSKTYRYRIGSGSDVSSWRTFRAPPAAGTDRLRLAVVGDIGQTEFSRKTCASLTAAHKAHAFDAAVLLGDISYADGTATRWDSFGRLFDESGCADVPWLVLPGNHEIEADKLSGEPFVPYRKRWRTPSNGPEEVGNDFKAIDWGKYHFKSRYDFGGSFWSVQLGPAHFIALNPYTDGKADSVQIKWLTAELERVNRSATPFLIVFTHAPWRGTQLLHKPADEQATRELMEAAEPLLVKAKATMLFSGHVHAYERSLPVEGIQHFIVGNGGNHEQLYNKWNTSAKTAFRSGEFYGWGELDLWPEAYNFMARRSHDSSILDSFAAALPSFAAASLPDRPTQEATAVEAIAGGKEEPGVGLPLLGGLGITGWLCCAACYWRARRARNAGKGEDIAFRTDPQVLGGHNPVSPGGVAE